MKHCLMEISYKLKTRMNKPRMSNISREFEMEIVPNFLDPHHAHRKRILFFRFR